VHIVILTNLLSLNDAADWIRQLVLQTLIGDGEKSDFVALARESREGLLVRDRNNVAAIEAGRNIDVPHRPLEHYPGQYYNEAESFYVEVRLNEAKDGLQICFQGQDWDLYDLRPYKGEEFEWFIKREEQAKRAR
jgi:hypothetical protein